MTKVVKYFLIHFAICVLFELINLAISGFDNYLNVFNFKNFVFTLPFMISIISFQVFTEEFVSRGLVSEMIRKVINNKYLIYATGAFLFALFHTSNPWVLKNPAFLSFFFIDGLAYYYFYVEDNSLGIPFALHLSNNIYSFMFVGSIYEKPFFGILVNTDSSDPNILIGFIFLLFKYSVVFLFFKNEKNNAPGLLKPANEEIISESLKSS
ncbi:MAG: CPBP family intramembrane metalloprotease [Spirochaetales bacterium]|nr:CPBP family intramembrane metalloprotease [Spirochaetales bacterium]